VTESQPASAALPAYRSGEEISAHPRFPEAFDAFVDGVASLYAHTSRMRGLLEYRQAVCFQLLVCFDAARDPARPETVFTTSGVVAAMAQMGVRNRRAVIEMIGRMADDGYVVISRAPHDRRAREIRATEKAREADREWLQVLHRPLSILYPDEARFQRPVERDPIYHHAYRAVSLATLGVASQVMPSHPEADYFVTANVGARIMMVLLQATRGRPDRRTDPGFYSWAADRSGVSRPHVRKLLTGAEERGLVILSGGSAVTVEVTPRMLHGVEGWCATALSATDLTSTLAWDLLTAT
jgi:hypothetical protein